MARYSVNNYTVETLLSNIKSGSIAIPEMQRPFVWDSSKVRDLVDSLYKGFPVGYIIVWQNPDVKLKDGTKSSGKKVLIDGQQRITAMAAAIVGQEVLDDHYKWKRISIAFNPVEEKFEVANNAFSGYQTTNLEFFHFHDVVAIFPLLLWGLEMSMKDRKYRPAFVLTIFINCLLNYFFFVGEVVFLVIYYLIRYRKLPVRQFVSGIFTCALYSG